jgi:hypothetical protein
MAFRKPVLRVITGLAAAPPHSALEAAYQHFRLERQGNRVSASTLEHYDWLVRPFLRWLAAEHRRCAA